MSQRLPVPIRSPEDSGSQSEVDDEQLAYAGALRKSVRAKVNAEQRSGKSLGEIVVAVREIVRLEEETRREPLPPKVFRVLARQAVGWCLEFYKPLLVTPRDDDMPVADGASPPLAPLALSPTSPNEGRPRLNYQPSGKVR